MSGHLVTSGDFIAITPNDSTELKGIRVLYIGGAGNLSLVNAQGATVTFNNIPAGFELRVRPSRVRLTDTTATNIIGYR